MRISPRVTLIPLIALVSASCNQAPPPTDGVNPAIAAQMLRKSEDILRIHFDLDTAMDRLSEASDAAQRGEDIQYLVAEAYDKVSRADAALLELGSDLQETFNLDAQMANER